MNEQQTQQYTTQKTILQTFGVPLAIVMAGAFIAGAVLMSVHIGRAAPVGVVPTIQAPDESDASLENLRAVSAEDHVRGNPDAPVKIVEYSDTECPFCKRFHESMKQIMDAYGESGKVAWVYRHFPLDQLHTKARKEAEALECAGAQGGNDAFWKYADRLYEITPSNDRLDSAELPKIAEYIGINVQTFTECLETGKYAEHVADDLANAVATGGRGTPWSIIIGPDGKKLSLNGAQPYSAIQQLIELALKGS